MLFPFPLELFPFPYPLVAQNYSHSNGNSHSWEWKFPFLCTPLISWTHCRANLFKVFKWQGHKGMRNRYIRASLSHWALQSFLHSSALSSSAEMQRPPSSLKQIMVGSSSPSVRSASIHVFWNLLCAVFIIKRV